MTSIAVVIPIRDRGGVRAENCLRSLRWQTLDARQVEIVLSDVGSDERHLSDLRRLAQAHDARLLETHDEGLFNRSRALNIGIQAARSEIVMCTDIDMIFENNFLASVLGAFAESDQRPFVLSKYCDLPPLPERVYDIGEFDSVKALSHLRTSSGTGACQAARRSFFADVHGYDEKMRHWGFEDSDMLARARRYGLTPVWISDRTSMLHQWHPKREYEHPVAVQFNRFRELLTRHIVVKNRGGWGGR